jgi:HSP20 family protein
MIADFSLGNMFFAPDLYRNFLKPDFSFLNKAPFLGEIGNFFNEWSPEVEMFDRDGKLVVQADLPGIKKDDIKVDITDRHLTIRGERKEEREEKDEGFYRSERTYGSFRREIPLPNGVKTDKAKAEFKNGVLEIAMEAPDLATRKRRLEIVGDESAKAVPK